MLVHRHSMEHYLVAKLQHAWYYYCLNNCPPHRSIKLEYSSFPLYFKKISSRTSIKHSPKQENWTCFYSTWCFSSFLLNYFLYIEDWRHNSIISLSTCLYLGFISLLLLRFRWNRRLVLTWVFCFCSFSFRKLADLILIISK